MRERSKLVEKLVNSSASRESFVRATLNTLIPSQLKALRLRQNWSQTEAGLHADMKQARISASEKPGKVKFSLETLIRFAATYKLGLIVKFVTFSEMERWENSYSQDQFAPARIEEDTAFTEGEHPNEAQQLAMGADAENLLSIGKDLEGQQSSTASGQLIGAMCG